MVSENKQCADILPYPSNTMRSEKKSRSIIPSMGEEEIYSIPGNTCNNCSQSEVTARRASSSISSAPRLNSSKSSQYLHTHTHTHRCMDAHNVPFMNPSLYPALCNVRNNTSSVFLGLFVNDTDTPHGTNARFRPRCSQCLSTKSPHWEDAARVTGGVNREGGGASPDPGKDYKGGIGGCRLE